ILLDLSLRVITKILFLILKSNIRLELCGYIDKYFEKKEFNGIYPGVGKTTSVSKYHKQNKLFITPFNKLAQELRKDNPSTNTLNRLLGFYADGKEYAKLNQMDISQYDCICFDEI